LADIATQLGIVFLFANSLHMKSSPPIQP
jgi:hypothetical protein